MNELLIDLTGKLARGPVEIYTLVHQISQELGIPYLVVGAMARDLVLVHGFDAKIERGTKDVDFGINVPSWEHFHALKERLLEAGFTAD